MTRMFNKIYTWLYTKEFLKHMQQKQTRQFVLHLGLGIYVVIIKSGIIMGTLENEHDFKSIIKINVRWNIKNKTD